MKKVNGHSHSHLAQAVTFSDNGSGRTAFEGIASNFEAVHARPELILAECHNGFTATLRACKLLGLDLSHANFSILQMFYTSGLCFAADDPMTPEQRALWRNSIVWPSQSKRTPESVYALTNLVTVPGKTPTEKSKKGK